MTMTVFVESNLEQQMTRTLAHFLLRLAVQYLHGQHHILQRRQIGDQVVGLKDKAQLLAPKTIFFPPGEASHIHAIDE